MGILKSTKGTSLDRTNIIELPVSGGETSPVAGSIVRRNAYGLIDNGGPYDNTMDLVLPSTCHVTVIPSDGSDLSYININDGVISDTSILDYLGDYIRLQVEGNYNLDVVVM